VIYNENGLYKNLKDVDRVRKTEEEFDTLSEMFINGLESVPKNIMAICLNKIKYMTDDKVEKEIDELIKIFEEKIGSKTFDKKQMILKMKMLSKRDDIIDAANSIKTFIENMEASQGYFYKSISNIITTLEKSYNETDINDAKKLLLEEVGINIDILYDKEYEKNHNNYINILKMLMENSGSIKFLKNKQLVDIQTLKEFIGEEESGRLTINDIIDFEKCVEFMDAL